MKKKYTKTETVRKHSIYKGKSTTVSVLSSTVPTTTKTTTTSKTQTFPEVCLLLLLYVIRLYSFL